MFTSEKIPCHLRSVKFKGDEEKGALECNFYITPLTYDLAYELSDRIAKQLFHKQGSVYAPIQEFGLTVLNLGEIDMQNMELYPHDDNGADGSGRMIPACTIGKVSVDKLDEESPDWSLIFQVSMPLDSNSLELCNRYYRKTVLITMEPAQEGLFDAAPKKPIILDDAEVEFFNEIFCTMCNKRAHYLGVDQSAWCALHVKAAVGIQVRKITYSDGVA